MAAQPSDLVSKKCYKCEHVNPEQAFCGVCGSPLVLDDFITTRVNERLTDAIRDRDVLETQSSIKVFEKAFGWLKILFWVVTVPFVIVSAVLGYQAWNFSKGIESAKQSVTDAARKSDAEVSAASSQSKQDISNSLNAAKSDIKTASDNAIRQSQSMQAQAIQSKAEISRNTASFRADVDVSRHQLQAAADLQPQIEQLRTKLAQTNADVEAQKKLLSNSQDLVKSIFATHRFDVFVGLPQHQGAPQGRYAIIPPPNGAPGTTIVLLLLTATPLPNTLQLQYHVFAQQPTTYFMIAHNLVIFFWGESAANLENKQMSASYFADLSDTEIIHSLSEHDGRWFADDQPLQKYGQPDPDWKGNKWTSPPQPASKP
jgi:hypothetical protein